jgi:Zn-dependent protease
MIHLGSIGGTSIDVDLSFLFLVTLWVVTRMNPGTPVAEALMWAPILFVSVLIHELAHAAAFAIFGYGSSHVVLNGWGGVTSNGSRTIRPWHDVVISIAGPLSSFGIAWAMTWVWGNVAAVHADPMLRAMVPALLGISIFWGFLNLIPVPPLDGGHAVRSFFRTFLREKTAFVIAIWIAIIGGGAAVLLGLYSRQWFLAVLVAFLVYRCIQQWQEFRKRGIIGD